jgi:CheY-like chemotaxis protein
MVNARVLLVEDDRFLRRAAEAALKQRGCTVLTATDGEEALRVAQEQLPDLILLDLIMPKLQGFELLRQLKDDGPTRRIPVIVVSNLSQETDVKQAEELGAVAYLVKANLSLDEMARRVEALVEQGRAS